MILLKQLYETLHQRKRPEDVAHLIFEILKSELSIEEKIRLQKATKNSLKNSLFGYTSMMQEFATVVGAQKQIIKTTELFHLKCEPINYNNVDEIQSFITEVSSLIHKTVGANNFKTNRLNKHERKTLGIEISKRAYNKKWRLLKRLELKLQNIIQEKKKIEFQKIGKHGFTHHLSFEEFKKNINSACFIAYYNAKSNLRSVFTNKKQDSAFDEIAAMLLKRCTEDSCANWFAIAHTYSAIEIVEQLNYKQQGYLLGKWTTILQETAQYLSEIWHNNKFNRQTMIVQKGNDSTTWNNTASAFNNSRNHWLNLIYAIGLDSILNEICFGKIMRLMAADVVAYHYETGSELDANTNVWNKLPLPWEVLSSEAICTKQLILEVCKEEGIDPYQSGWLAPKSHKVVPFKPTPELVHGVAIQNPFLATILKKEKFFSGK